MAVGTTRRTVVAGAVYRTFLVLGALRNRRDCLDEIGNVVKGAAELHREDEQ